MLVINYSDEGEYNKGQDFRVWDGSGALVRESEHAESRQTLFIKILTSIVKTTESEN